MANLNTVAQAALPSAPDGPSKGSRTGKKRSRRHQNEFHEPRGLCQATIDKLPDDVLLEIFYFYLNNEILHGRRNVDGWHTLVHVCRRWRNVVFASPRRLDLRLLCQNTRPVRANLDIWPALPINVVGVWDERWDGGKDNVVAALERPDRVRSINLTYIPTPQGRRPAAETTMQARFPELAEMRVRAHGRPAPVLPDSFLGGSAPRLRTLQLMNVIFPAAPTLLLSVSDLVNLRLDNLPHLGYIPPASMVAYLSPLNKLESFSLGFESPQSRPDQPRPPPQSRVVLPALISLGFEGGSEYLEDLVGRIDAPLLNRLHITFFPEPVFDVRYLKQFVSRAERLKPSKAAEMWISSYSIHLSLRQSRSLTLGVRCDRSDWQLSSFALLCSQVSHLFCLVERLDLPNISPSRKTIRESTRFLEIFLLFPATRSLYVPAGLMPLIASVLHELIGERATEVLPNLRDLTFWGSARSESIRKVMRPFVNARRLSGQTVAVHYLKRRRD